MEFGAGQPQWLHAERRIRLGCELDEQRLVAAHVAMIAGMLDPTLLGWQPTHTMPGGQEMAGMGM